MLTAAGWLKTQNRHTQQTPNRHTQQTHPWIGSSNLSPPSPFLLALVGCSSLRHPAACTGRGCGNETLPLKSGWLASQLQQLMMLLERSRHEPHDASAGFTASAMWPSPQGSSFNFPAKGAIFPRMGSRAASSTTLQRSLDTRDSRVSPCR